MARCTIDNGEECADMKEIKEAVWGKYGIKSKVSWTALATIAGLVLLSIIGTIIWFSDIRVQAKDFPKVKEQVNQNVKDIGVLDERTKNILTAQNKTIHLLEQVLTKLDTDKKKKDKEQEEDK
jgi:hypothetical protein